MSLHTCTKGIALGAGTVEDGPTVVHSKRALHYGTRCMRMKKDLRCALADDQFAGFKARIDAEVAEKRMHRFRRSSQHTSNNMHWRTRASNARGESSTRQ